MLLRYFYCALLLCAACAFAQGEVSADKVVVVANAKDKRSVALAKFYMEKRQIPERNLFLVEAPTGETITRDVFYQTVFNPLREQLVAAKWINGVLSGNDDAMGRRELAPLGHGIDFMVLCRLPLRISPDEVRRDLEAKSNIPGGLRTNAASVDAELALLAAGSLPLGGPLQNPLFDKEAPSRLQLDQVVRVARLDGPGDSAQQMIESALEAEQIGLRGMVYLDLSQRAPAGDEWLLRVGAQLASLYYPVITEREKRIMDWRDRTDGAAFYFGWWSERPRGPMLEADYRYSPGALGWHIYSFSASTIRTPNMWAPIMIRGGITGTAGNVYEPYLHLVHRPDKYIEGLLKGMSAGEAAYYSLPTLSWMCLYAGDPLYRPFKVGLDEQLAQVAADPASPLAQYVVLREAERRRAAAVAAAGSSSTAARAGDRAALEYLLQASEKVSGLALSYEVARLLELQSENRRAVRALEPFTAAATFNNEYIPLAGKAAELLVQLGNREAALGIYRAILSGEELRDGVWIVYATAGVPLARQFGAADEAAAWEGKVAEIRARLAEAERKRQAERARRAAEQKAAAGQKKAAP